MADPMREALEHIVAASGFECERFTTGIGSCFREGKTPDAEFLYYRCCPACTAHNALCESGMRNDAEMKEKRR